MFSFYHITIYHIIIRFVHTYSTHPIDCGKHKFVVPMP